MTRKRDVFEVTIIFKGNPVPVKIDCYQFNLNKDGSEMRSMSWELVDPNRRLLFTNLDEIAHIQSRLKSRG